MCVQNNLNKNKQIKMIPFDIVPQEKKRMKDPQTKRANN